MTSLKSIDLTLSLEPVFLILGTVIALLYTFFIYKYTLPKVSRVLKVLLILIRTLAFFLIILILLEPIISVNYSRDVVPANLVFIDNSKSIVNEDSLKRSNQINSFLFSLSSGLDNKIKLYTFGKQVKEIDPESTSVPNYSEGSTNFNNILNFLKEYDGNIASAAIISDGIITDGINPIYKAEKLGIPFYTIGIGDSTEHPDILIKNILYNKFVYKDAPTKIEAVILNRGFSNRPVSAALFASDTLVEKKKIILGESGVNKINFDFFAKESGTKKLMLVISPINNEISKANNKKIFFINVIESKLKILLLSSSPSSDLSFVYNSLKLDKDLVVSRIIQLTGNKFLAGKLNLTKIDSADALFLIGFPTRNTPSNLLSKTKNAIKNGKPFFISFAAGIDFKKLKELQSYLPIKLGQYLPGYISVQPQVTEINNPLLVNGYDEYISMWENLPPINQPQISISVKPEAKIIIKSKVKNTNSGIPLLTTRSAGRNRSIALAAADIWKWKLQNSNIEQNLFDSFFINTVKWLTSNTEQKKVTIKTTKRFYNGGESVEFNAQIYDESFNPVSDAEVKIKINSAQDNFELTMNSEGNGLYKSEMEAGSTGDYKYEAAAKLGEETLGKDFGRFTIGELQIEKMNYRMDKNFLHLLAKVTDGKYFDINSANALINLMKADKRNTSTQKTSTVEINLFSEKWLLYLLIFLFGIEWFLRKRAGML